MNAPRGIRRHLIGLRSPGLMILLAFLLAACNLPSSAAGAGPRAWIDYPANGMSFSPGPIVVQSHASSGTQVRQVDLYINGTRTRTDLNPDSTAGLVSMSQAWLPEEPGAYTLEVRAADSAGNEGRSLPIRITVGAAVQPPPGSNTPTPGATATPGTASPAPAACVEPTATLTLNGNCRGGPGTTYDPVDVLLAGTSVRIVGRTEDNGWWQVQRPGGGTCWLSSVAASVCGNVEGLAVIAPAQPPAAQPPPPPPPPAAAKPAAPGKLSVTEHVCSGSTYSVTLGWNDSADNEDGYRVYRGKDLLATLGAGADSYSDNPPVGGPYTYRVESFNGTGASSATTQDAGCIF